MGHCTVSQELLLGNRPEVTVALMGPLLVGHVHTFPRDLLENCPGMLTELDTESDLCSQGWWGPP